MHANACNFRDTQLVFQMVHQPTTGLNIKINSIFFFCIKSVFLMHLVYMTVCLFYIMFKMSMVVCCCDTSYCLVTIRYALNVIHSSLFSTNLYILVQVGIVLCKSKFHFVCLFFLFISIHKKIYSKFFHL